MCPTDLTLQQFLDGTLPADDQPTLEGHVQTCAACQQSLDRLTAFATAAWLPDGERPAGPAPRPVVPDYDLEDEIGRGGYGVVYRATDRRLGRTVAVKVLKHGALADAADRRRFLTEARAAARLRHPNIVPIFEVGEADGVPYIVMEHGAGGPLSRHLDGTPLAARAAAELVETVARAVQHAHAQGVVHRDLKPGNVLLSPQSLVPSPQSEDTRLGTGDWRLGTPKVADFGTARLLDAPGELTPTQAVLGTPSYMAPEQAGGQSRGVGPAADVYSLGAILYEVLTGRPPFKATTPFETLLLVREQDPVPVRRLNPAVPRDLETVALTCLEKDPGRRYASAGDLADDLRRWLDRQPIRARPVGPVGRFARWAGRHPGVAVLSVALVVFVLGALVAVTVLWRRSVEQAELAERRGRQARENVRLATDALDQCVRLVAAKRGQGAPLTPAEERTVGVVLDLFDRLATDPGTDPAARATVAEGLEQVAAFYWFTGDRDRATRVRERSVAVLDGLAAEFPADPEYPGRLARRLTSLAEDETAHRAERLRRADGLFRRARAADPDRADWAHGHAYCLLNLFWQDVEAGNMSGAVARAEEARAITDDRVARNPDDHGARLLSASAAVALGNLRGQREGDWEAALAGSRAAIDCFRWQRARYPDVMEGVESGGMRYATAADCLWRLGRRAEAVETLREGRTALAEAAARFPRFAAVKATHFHIAARLTEAVWLTDPAAAGPEAAAARRAADPILADPAAFDPAVLAEVGHFLARGPGLEHRDLAAAGRPAVLAGLRQRRLDHIGYLVAVGRPAEAAPDLAAVRADAGAGPDPGARHRVGLLEVLVLWGTGEREAARRRAAELADFRGHAWEAAIEHDLFRQQVAAALSGR